MARGGTTMQSGTAAESVLLTAESVKLNGDAKLILCASLFYFRIPRALWKDRLLKVKQFGYNCIDVYFPWNDHERQEGVWDFQGEKDAQHFLRLAAECGLLVVARPGPYICSEWDGGALPAYLLTKENLRLRDNNPEFLQHVGRWYERIMPILREAQWGRGGTVIAVQLDNELDFYGCEDPHGYISALRDMALRHGISVPLIACAGQGGIYEASGLADHVVPTCNFYPNDRDPCFEEKVLVYRSLLAERGLPLLVTETNRSHFLLRRLLGCGAKLLGPYLQVSGTNFGFTNATNNWGKPLALLTSDYDFGGMISSSGEPRPEAYEGRLLSRVIDCYGKAIAEALPIGGEPERHGLKLKGGGELLFFPNVSEDDRTFRFELGGDPAESMDITARSGSCPIVPVGVPLEQWGLPGAVLSAGAELFYRTQLAKRTVIAFHTDTSGRIRIDAEHPIQVEAFSMRLLERSGTHIVFSFTAEQPGSALIRIGDRRAKLIGMSREQALLVESYEEGAGFILTASQTAPLKEVEFDIQWTLSETAAFGLPSGLSKELGDHASHLERNGVYRGYAWYEASAGLPQPDNCVGVLVQNAADIISVYADGAYAGTVVPGGGHGYVPLQRPPAGSDRVSLLARTEIWGHSNFDDPRLPALRLHSLKGLTGMVAVTAVKDITQNWSYEPWESSSAQGAGLGRDRACSRPLVSFGGWLSGRSVHAACYRKQVVLSPDCDSWFVHLPGFASLAELYVDGQLVGEVNPLDPYVDITSLARPGTAAELMVILTTAYGSPAGSVKLYEGVAAKQWRLTACEEEGLLQWAEASRTTAKPVNGIVRCAPGQVNWLYGTFGDRRAGGGWRVHCSGSNVKLTVFLGEVLIGRLWLGSEPNRPAMRGGDPDSFYIPGPWLKANTELAIMIEAVTAGEEGVLDTFRFVPVEDEL
ncbi:beta-galactosidase [Paenibacillus chartarius]|uniref:Beta-galactosidase n=1 Tax=Paenibacillus chartarius TaxID=747481 RepID=A0ABV6DHT6_9BACL